MAPMHTAIPAAPAPERVAPATEQLPPPSLDLSTLLPSGTHAWIEAAAA
jgi:hypothetical protein